MLVRVGTGQDGGVTNGGHRHAVRLVGVAERRALLQQAAKSALAELVAVALHLLVRQAVDDEDDKQFRL